MIGSACLICGKRIPVGSSRCVEHATTSLRMGSSCVKCGQPATSGPYCEQHKPAQTRSAQPYRRGYSDPAYHRERQATLNRAAGACERCGRYAPLQVDHIVPLRDGGANTRQNLQALCHECHARKTAADRRRRSG